MPSTATSTAKPRAWSSCRSSSRTVIESSTTRIRFRCRDCSAIRSNSTRESRRPMSTLSIERTRSSTSTISTGSPFSRSEALLMSGTFPSRGSSGRTSRSRSPRNASTIMPNCWPAVADHDHRHRVGRAGRGRASRESVRPSRGRSTTPSRSKYCRPSTVRMSACAAVEDRGRSGSAERRRARRRSRRAGRGSPTS